MINVVYLVLVMNFTSTSHITSQTIPQASMQQCLANKKAYDEKTLASKDRYSADVNIRATCIVGVK